MRRIESRASRRVAVVLAAGISAAAGLAAPGGPRPDAQAAVPAAEARRITVGDVAPDFTLRDPAGLAYHLGALRGKEAVVLVFFRGVW